MNRILIIATMMLMQGAAYCQDKVPVHMIRLGNINNSTTTYKGSKIAVKEMKTTWKDILETPMLTCETGDCVVTHFTISVIPKGHDIYGPYSGNGANLNSTVQQHMTELADANDRTAKIVVEDIKVMRAGREEAVNGALYYTIK